MDTHTQLGERADATSYCAHMYVLVHIYATRRFV